MVGLRYGLIGDSSLYTKRPNKKKSHVAGELKYYQGFENLTYHVFPGGGVQDFYRYFAKEVEFDVLGVSYFGNEHTQRRMMDCPHQAEVHRKTWHKILHLLRKNVKRKVVFFIGGYAEKYNYGRVYDENLGIIKKWVRDFGFPVIEAKHKVARWQLCSDRLHFTAEVLPELAAFWSQLLTPKTGPEEEPRGAGAAERRSDAPRRRGREESPPSEDDWPPPPAKNHRKVPGRQRFHDDDGDSDGPECGAGTLRKYWASLEHRVSRHGAGGARGAHHVRGSSSESRGRSPRSPPNPPPWKKMERERARRFGEDSRDSRSRSPPPWRRAERSSASSGAQKFDDEAERAEWWNSRRWSHRGSGAQGYRCDVRLKAHLEGPQPPTGPPPWWR